MQQKKVVNNAIYKTTIEVGASRFKQLAWYYTNIIFFTSAWMPLSGLKVFFLKAFGARVGRGVVVKPSVNIKYPWKLQIGDHSWIGEGVWIDNLADVIIGNNVTLSQGCLLLTGSHDHTRETFDFKAFPVILEDGVWIAAKAVVFGGVICKSHSILGINSVAEKNLDAYTVYKGNPAIPVLQRTIT